MPLVRVAAASLNQIPLDWEGNLQNICAAISEAREAGAKLLCLPELCVTGYGCEDSFLWPHVSERALQQLSQLKESIRKKTKQMKASAAELNMFHAMVSLTLCG